MKKTLIVLLLAVLPLLGLSLYYFSNSAAALPSDLELNVTFGYFSLSADGTTYTQIVSSPTTVNLLSSAATSGTGSPVTITPPPTGTYKYLKMSVTSIKFKQGTNEREILPILKAQSGGNEDWNAMVVPILPVTYSGGSLQLNMYMPDSNISGTSFDTYFPDDAPVFSFTGDNVSVDTSQIGTANITISSGITAGNKLFIGAFESFSQQAAPSFTGTLTNAGNGSASGTMYLPPGTWYLMAIEQSGAMTASGPPVGSKAYTAGGIKPWESAPTATTITAQQTTNATLAYAFEITATEGKGGGAKTPKGTASMTLTASASPSAFTVGSNAQLMLYAFTSEAGAQAGGPPTYFLGSYNVSAGTFSSVNITASDLAAGTYAVIALLDVNGSGKPETGDYFGGYGGMPPTLITLTAGQTQDLTGTPISLTAYTGN